MRLIREDIYYTTNGASKGERVRRTLFSWAHEALSTYERFPKVSGPSLSPILSSMKESLPQQMTGQELS